MLLLLVALSLAHLAPSTGGVKEFFCQRFDNCEGSNIGDGWYNQDLIRGSYYNFVTEDLWRCDNPGEQESAMPIDGKFAIFDSDAISSSDSLPENSALTSPVFDTRDVDFATQAIVVDWDQYFVGGYEAKIFVEVWSGHAWIEVYSETETTFNPDHQSIDVTEHVAAGVESRVRFRWTGDASWFWMVDNVRVLLVDLTVQPNGCPAERAHKCANDGACVADAMQCLADNNCPAARPVRCLDGSCVAAGEGDASMCSDLVDCPADAPVRCANGACAASHLACMSASNCPLSAPQRCADGSCAANPFECPLTLACPDEYNPYPCRGGACAAAPELCPKTKATDLVCPCDMVQCPDLTCARSYAECECPCEYPYLCVESRTCVQESIFCKETSLPSPAVVAERFGGAGAVRMVRVDACPDAHFRCFDGTCAPSLAMCPDVPCASFQFNGHETPAEELVKCPDGSCARHMSQCAPIPACSSAVGGGRWLKRCGDGTCVRTDEECAAVDECSFGRVRCPDGRCYAKHCPAFHGCPVNKPMECPNGQCATNEAQCYAGCGPKQHTCYDGDECQAWSEDCRAPPSDHRAVPFEGNLNCIAIREDAMYYDVVIVADRYFDDLFATVMVPVGLMEAADADAKIVAEDVPLSEVRPLPPYPQTISHVLRIALPASIFAADDFVRVTMRVEMPAAAMAEDYCLAELADGEWVCRDNELVQDGEHLSGLVQSVGGVFAVMKKPGVCHRYRGFSDNQLEFVLLGRVIPRTIERLQTLHDRLSLIRDRMDEIKQSNAVLTYIAKATYGFTEQCLSDDWQAQLSTFPEQLGYKPHGHMMPVDDAGGGIGDGGKAPPPLH